MNDFDRRWKQAAAAARTAQPGLPEEAPYGFVERVLANRLPPGESVLAVLWQALALRTLGTMAIALLLLLTYERIATPQEDLSPPELESAVADSLPLP